MYFKVGNGLSKWLSLRIELREGCSMSPVVDKRIKDFLFDMEKMKFCLVSEFSSGSACDWRNLWVNISKKFRRERTDGFSGEALEEVESFKSLVATVVVNEVVESDVNERSILWIAKEKKKRLLRMKERTLR